MSKQSSRFVHSAYIIKRGVFAGRGLLSAQQAINVSIDISGLSPEALVQLITTANRATPVRRSCQYDA